MKHCSRCGRNVVTEMTYPFGGKAPSVPPWNFCPWCGFNTGERMTAKKPLINRIDELEKKVDAISRTLGLNHLAAYVASLGANGNLAEPKPYTEEDLIRMVDEASGGEVTRLRNSRRRVRK